MLRCLINTSIFAAAGLFLAGCSANMGSSSISNAGFGYAANTDSLTYGTTPKPGSSARTRTVTRPPEPYFPRNKAEKKDKASNDDMKPGQYQDLRDGRTKTARNTSPAAKKSFGKSSRSSSRKFSNVRLSVTEARTLINGYRSKRGLKSLNLNASLTKAAMAHSRDLARFDRISHHGSDGSDPWDRVKRTGYKASLAAENVGTGQSSLKEVFKGWQDSPGHNANLLLKDATQMGIALVYDPKTEYRTFWTLVIGSPL